MSLPVTMTEENIMGAKKESESRNDQIQGVRGQAAVVDPQLDSLLFQRLPQEMRHYIYRTLLSCTRLMLENEQG